MKTTKGLLPKESSYPALACMSEGCMRSCYEDISITHNPNEYCYIAESDRRNHQSAFQRWKDGCIEFEDQGAAQAHIWAIWSAIGGPSEKGTILEVDLPETEVEYQYKLGNGLVPAK